MFFFRSRPGAGAGGKEFVDVQTLHVFPEERGGGGRGFMIFTDGLLGVGLFRSGSGYRHIDRNLVYELR